MTEPAHITLSGERAAARSVPGSAVELKGVGKAYGDQSQNPRWAVRQIDLTVPDGQFVTIVGQSGCGKSTLIRLVDHLIEPTEGMIEVFGEQTKGVPPGVSMVFQDIKLLPWCSVRKNVELALRPLHLDRASRRERALEVLRMVRMEGRCDDDPHELSGGMQQRVGVARALATWPRLLLMDEPFGQLDSFTRQELQAEFREIAQHLAATCIFVTHDIGEAILLSDRIVVLGGSPGNVIADIQVDLPPGRSEQDVRADPAAIALHNELELILRGSAHRLQGGPGGIA